MTSTFRTKTFVLLVITLFLVLCVSSLPYVCAYMHVLWASSLPCVCAYMHCAVGVLAAVLLGNLYLYLCGLQNYQICLRLLKNICLSHLRLGLSLLSVITCNWDMSLLCSIFTIFHSNVRLLPFINVALFFLFNFTSLL